MFGTIHCLKSVQDTDRQIAAIGGTFEFTRIAAANLREKDDVFNQAIGGFFGGGVVGFRSE